MINQGKTIQIWAGSGERFCKKSIRMWTIPKGYSIAMPTIYFYKKRNVILSNEGNILHQNWVALDRNNDVNWINTELTLDDCVEYYVEEIYK